MSKKRKQRPIKEHLDHFPIAGFTYYDGAEAFEALKIGSELELELDPDNGYDKRAVMIFYKDYHLGYIPREKNRIFYKLLRTGVSNLRAIVQRIDPQGAPRATS